MPVPHMSGQLTAAGRLSIYAIENNLENENFLLEPGTSRATLMDRETAVRPHRRTALIAKELARYNIDTAALSYRLAEEGSRTEPSSSYTCFWKRKKQTEDRIHGTGFAIKPSLVGQLTDLPVGLNERLRRLRLSLSHKRHATIISAYAPTLTRTEEVIEQFYADLSSSLCSVPAHLAGRV